MERSLSHLVDVFARRKILVVGEAMLDVYLEGTTNKLCREAPVPVISIGEKKYVPGGAANTAVNIAALGGCVRFLSVVGDDREGATLKKALAERGVDARCVIEDGNRRTLVKNRVIASSQMLLRFDEGGTGPLSLPLEDRVGAALAGLYEQCDALIVSDYGYGFFSSRIIEQVRGLRERLARIVVVDAKHPERYRTVNVTAVKPNYGEAIKLLGVRRLREVNARAKQIAAHEEQLYRLTGASIVAVTMDTEGAIVFERGKPAYRTYTTPTLNVRATGAGDTFVSALTLALAAGAGTPAAAELASAAAAIVVSKEGTAVCSSKELLGYLSAGSKHVKDVAHLELLASFYHKQGAKIIFTNGCFDILHRGHVTYLSRAKALGDVLIVGINADDSVRRLKGDGRPINTLDDRLDVIAALSCVDHVVGFADDTPQEIIRMLRPHIMVKGGDYTRETLPEAALVESLGGTVHILPYLEDNSTTGIIERIAGKGRPVQDTTPV